MVVNHLRLLLHQRLPRVFLVLDDLRQHLVQPLDNGDFVFAEGHLVRHLEDVAERLGALAIKSAHRQPELVDGLDDGIDLLGQDESGQMQHGAHADARAEVGRARGQVTQFVAEGVRELLLQLGIQPVNRAPRLPQLQAGAQRLHPQVVLLVNHHAKRFVAIQHQAAAGTFRGMFAADEVPLHQDLLVQRVEIVHRLGEGVLHFRQALHRRPDQFKHADALRLFRPARKRRVLQIARQPHAAGHDNPVVRAVPLRGLRR